jgi:hypothetical protein
VRAASAFERDDKLETHAETPSRVAAKPRDRAPRASGECSPTVTVERLMNQLEWHGEKDFSVDGVRFRCELNDHSAKTTDERFILLKDRDVL